MTAERLRRVNPVCMYRLCSLGNGTVGHWDVRSVIMFTANSICFILQTSMEAGCHSGIPFFLYVNLCDAQPIDHFARVLE